jgi:WD40 repeat protein
MLALGQRDDVILLDVVTLEPVRRLVGGGEVMDVAFSPDGTQVAAGARDHTVTLWHLDEEAVR